MLRTQLTSHFRLTNTPSTRPRAFIAGHGLANRCDAVNEWVDIIIRIFAAAWSGYRANEIRQWGSETWTAINLQLPQLQLAEISTQPIPLRNQLSSFLVNFSALNLYLQEPVTRMRSALLSSGPLAASSLPSKLSRLEILWNWRWAFYHTSKRGCALSAHAFPGRADWPGWIINPKSQRDKR